MYRVYKPKIVKNALNLWPPFWGAGISITSISDDFQCVSVRLKHRWWNKNANRSQYGGSIFSMTDPIFSLMLMGILREKYYVWDSKAEIEFIKPGFSILSAEFVISEEVLNQIYANTESGDKYFPQFETEVLDKKGVVVARIKRTLYIRKKPQFRSEELKNAL
ncbi:DUF4442 domain-containing protein [Aliivibrio kagoshimensis]|uniref:DUF4442 domain-containing protein n=1 Tax=Aliivibrio kagoshimensis TaxID=2910230 RepID=UPI003D0BFFBC